MAPYAPPIRRPLLISLSEGLSQSHLHPSHIQTMSPVVRIIIEMIVMIPEQRRFLDIMQDQSLYQQLQYHHLHHCRCRMQTWSQIEGRIVRKRESFLRSS